MDRFGTNSLKRMRTNYIHITNGVFAISYFENTVQKCCTVIDYFLQFFLIEILSKVLPSFILND